MGNNKGRSKGCKTCLERRVKCDETRPVCKRCVNANFDCRGYRESFVDGREQILRRMRRTASLSEKKAASPSTTGSDQELVNICQGSNESQFVFYYSHQPPLYTILSVGPWKNDICLSYLTANTTGPIATVCGNLALQSYQPDSLQNRATRLCFTALATTFFGVSHAQKPLVHEGRRLYSLALQTISATISDTSCYNSEILCAVFVLSLHEAIEPTQDSKHLWLNHISGLEHLFAVSRSAIEKNESNFNALLEETRLIMIVAALSTRRPSIMARPEWSAVGNSGNKKESSSSSTLAYLLDSLAQIPELYHEQDVIVSHRKQPSQIRSEEESYSSRVQTLLEKSQAVLHNIHSRMCQRKDSHLDSVVTNSSFTNVASSQPYPCTLVTHFSSLAAAKLSILYSSILVLLNQFVVSLYNLLPIDKLDVLAYQLALDQTSLAVRDILTSIEYQLTSPELHNTRQLDASGPGSFYLLLPIRIAHRALAQSKLPAEVSQRVWLEDVSSMIESRFGPWASNKHLFKIKKR